MADTRLIILAINNAGLEENCVLGKTEEILRKLLTKMPLGTLKKAEACRHIIAVEIACNALHLQVDRDKLITSSLISKKVYQDNLLTCKNMLGIKHESDCMSILAVRYGSHFTSRARGILNVYKEKSLDKLDKSRQSSNDSNSAVCQAAAFYIASHHYDNVSLIVIESSFDT